MWFSRAKSFVVAALLTGSVLLMSGGRVGAVPLDDAACEQLKLEQAALLLSGTRENMAQGPDWAKANLPASKLKEIERLIEVDEQLLFRCPRPTPAEAETSGEEEPAKSAAAPKQKSAARPAAAVPVPVRKPKINDAYVPPPKAKP